MKDYTTEDHYQKNRTMLRRFPGWAGLWLDQITPEMIRKKLTQLALELGNHNANRHLRTLKALFMLAWKDGHIPRNPCLGIPMFPTKRPTI